MPVPNPPLLPEDNPDLDLDRRIELVEQRLIARQTRVKAQLKTVGQRVNHAATSGRVLLPVVAGGSALALLWLLLRKRPAARHVNHHDAAPRRRGRLSTLLWAQVPALAMALLPARWGIGRPAGGSSIVVGALMPLIRSRFANRAEPVAHDAPMPVVGVDLQRFAGSWLQLARLPHVGRPAAAGLTTLTFTANGREFGVQQRSLRPGRRALTQEGVVRVVPGSNGARLQMCFAPVWARWLPMVWEDHWVLHIEADYSAALIGNPQRTRLGLLVRRFKGCEPAVNRMLANARLQGFAVDDLEFASSAAGRQPDAPPREAAHAHVR